MRRTLIALLLTCSLGCGWPPYPGTGGDGISTCGTDWRDAVPGHEFPNRLNAVFATEDAVYAVGPGAEGENKNEVWTLNRGMKPQPPCKLGADPLNAIWVDGQDIYIAGKTGIYQTDINAPCSIKELTPASNCSGIWISNEAVYAACGDEIKLKKPKTAAWTATQPAAGQIYYTVVSSGNRLVAGSTLRSGYLIDLPSTSWMPIDTFTNVVNDGWVNSQGKIYLTGNQGALVSIEPTSRTPVEERAKLDMDTRLADLTSIWGRGANLYITGTTASGSIIWEGSDNIVGICAKFDNHTYLNIHANGSTIYVVGVQGSGQDSKGLLRCKRTN